MSTIMDVKNLKKYFRAKTDIAGLFSRKTPPMIKAVDDISFDVASGEIVGLVGESGSGKSTIARLLTRLERPDSGEIRIDGLNVNELIGRHLKEFYRHVQMIFQDPYESINPRFMVYDTVVEPVKVQGLAPKSRHFELVTRALERAGLKKENEYISKFPHELSGGERQRLSIARALVVEPKILIADEPVSMLDVSIKAGILNLLKELSQKFGMTILYVSHDLSTVKYLCDRIIIMYLGKFMEIGKAEDVIDHPKHPYTRALKAAIPIPDPTVQRPRVSSDNIYEKSLLAISGCRYSSECPYAQEVCRETQPELIAVDDGRKVACYLYDGSMHQFFKDTSIGG
jgi:peptide/nickel transport system ATP-binding protein